MKTLTTCAVAIATLMAGCSDSERSAQPSSQGRLAVEVARLGVGGISDATYKVTVREGVGATGDAIWEARLSSSELGGFGGALSQVVPCEPDAGAHTVTLWLETLYGLDGEVIDATTYLDPSPVTRTAECIAGEDAAVRFDMTIVRDAEHGFFDAAVSFDEVYCSARLDCVAPDTGDDLELLEDPTTDTRALTAVIGFACTGPPLAETFLYMDDPVVVCDGLATEVNVDASALGQVELDLEPNLNRDGYLFGARVYRGEDAATELYWNISLGLDGARFAEAQGCRLSGHATASSTTFVLSEQGWALPEGQIYPVVEWQVDLTDAGGRVCANHDLHGDDGVAAVYVGYLGAVDPSTWSPEQVFLAHRYSKLSDEVVSATDFRTCASGPCGPGARCADQRDGYACSCKDGFYSDLAGCARCAPVAHCATDGLRCGDATDSVCSHCQAGFAVDAGACAEIDECAGDPRGPHSDCLDGLATYDCTCSDGYFDDGKTCATCASIARCAEGAVTCTDRTDSTCSRCVSGFVAASGGCAKVGAVSEGLELTSGALRGSRPSRMPPKLDPTVPTPREPVCSPRCVHGACVATNSCDCKSGWGGATCTMRDICSPNPCGPNGTCGPSAGTYTCDCADGDYDDGTTCAACTPVPHCEAGAVTCTNSGDSVCSSCVAGYTLEDGACVDDNDCAGNPCAPNGTCTDAVDSYTCDCAAGYYDDDTTCAECAPVTNCVSAVITCTDDSDAHCDECAPGYEQLVDGAPCTDSGRIASWSVQFPTVAGRSPTGSLRAGTALPGERAQTTGLVLWWGFSPIIIGF